MTPASSAERIAEIRARLEAATPGPWIECCPSCAIDEPRAALASGEGTAEPEQLAQRFHEAYERLAPQFGYETRRESAVRWADVPAQNRLLMIAVCAEILPTILRAPDGPWTIFGNGGPWVSVTHAHGRSLVLHGMAEATEVRDALNRVAAREGAQQP